LRLANGSDDLRCVVDDVLGIHEKLLIFLDRRVGSRSMVNRKRSRIGNASARSGSSAASALSSPIACSSAVRTICWPT
jgi:hypothetical protein